MDEGTVSTAATAPPRSRPARGVPPVVGSARRPRRSDRVFGIVLVLLWLTWLVLTALGQQRLVTPAQLTDDLDAGRVIGWEVVALAADETGWSWSRTIGIDLPAATDDGTTDPAEPRVAGEEALGYWVDGPFARFRIVDPALAPGEQDVLAEQARAAGVPRLSESVRTDVSTYQQYALADDRARYAALPLVLLTFASVVIGPRPTRATRWFWFWQLWFPLGLGVLAYAVLEQLRPAAATTVPRARPTWNGWGGLALLVLGSMLVSAVVVALADGTHWLWVVRP
ncbi:hypothetical protein [Phycicoccus duodecadis]|uniref:Uncharacterized protein n=1 Tax=Phycicoccus duodecadis TaxID=173053 RepID=A0A2N3YL92_9MICO|nr:hypothetical protein [Phycicoccus duodecadis]PKW27614.1 hypothetical protein ATL31_2463 [Phycicoccus duodecadis]